MKKAWIKVCYLVYVSCPYCGCPNSREYNEKPHSGDTKVCELCEKEFEFE